MQDSLEEKLCVPRTQIEKDHYYSNTDRGQEPSALNLALTGSGMRGESCSSHALPSIGDPQPLRGSISSYTCTFIEPVYCITSRHSVQNNCPTLKRKGTIITIKRENVYRMDDMGNTHLNQRHFIFPMQHFLL